MPADVLQKKLERFVERQVQHMPRVHFNLFDGVAIIDRHGHEVPDNYATRIVAGKIVSAINDDAEKGAALGDRWGCAWINDPG